MIILLAFVSASTICVLLTILTNRVCTQRGWVARPRADRWHRGTPSLFGGVPVWLSFMATTVLFLPQSSVFLWKLMWISSFVFLLGLADDIWGLSARTKFLLEALAASLVLAVGVVYPFRESLVINLAVSAAWIIGITNAFNLIDNIDGLSGGIALISAFYLALIYLHHGAKENVLILAILGGTLGGFLLFNFHPARIFMGDAGSLFIGFLLATICLLDVTHLSGLSAFLFLPVLVLTVPIFDTFFVSVTRRLRGQPISRGGTDHTSHRLVGLGIRERSAVLVLYFFSALAGAVAFGIRRSSPQHSVLFIALWFLFLMLFGIHLFHTEQRAAAADPRVGMARFMMDPDSLAFVLDPLILSLSYYAAFFFRFVGTVPKGDLALFLRSWPIVVAIKFLSLWGSKIYRRSWWRGSRQDLYLLLQAVVVGEILSVVALVGIERFAGYSRAIFALDGLTSAVLLVIARQSASIFRDFTGRLQNSPNLTRRVFLLGTSRWAELNLRFLSDFHIKCVGLIDLNHGSDLGKRIWGVPVLGHLGDLADLAREYEVREIVLAENEAVPDFEAQIHLICKELQIKLLRIGLYEAMNASKKEIPTF